LVFMGIGVVILIIAVASITNSNNNNANSNSNRTANRNANANTNKNANSETNANENSNSRSTLTNFTDDFSKEDWRTGASTYGTMWYSNEEYHMKALRVTTSLFTVPISRSTRRRTRPCASARAASTVFRPAPDTASSCTAR